MKNILAAVPVLMWAAATVAGSSRAAVRAGLGHQLNLGSSSSRGGLKKIVKTKYHLSDRANMFTGQ